MYSPIIGSVCNNQNCGQLNPLLMPKSSHQSDLYMAIMFKQLPTFRLMLDKLRKGGTDLVKIRLMDGHTPLGFAIKYHANEIANYLIGVRLGINELGKENQSPLHLAIRYNNIEMLKKLLQCVELDVNMDIGDPYHSPLQHMVQSLRQDCIIRQITSHPNFRIDPSFPIIPRWLLLERNCTLKSTFKSVDYLLNTGFYLFAHSPQENPLSTKKIRAILTVLLANPETSHERVRRQVENSYGRRFAILSQNGVVNLNCPLTLKQLARHAVRVRMLSTGRAIIQQRLANELKLPEQLCSYIWDVTI